MAPPRLSASTSTLPTIEMIEASMLPAPPPPPSAYVRPLATVPTPARRDDRLARVGLVVSVVLALVGTLAAVARSGDDETKTDTAGVVMHEPAPDGQPADPAPPTDDTVAAAAVPDGFHLIEGDDITLAVPLEWETLDPADLGLTGEDLADFYPEADPGVLRMATRMIEQGAIFMAIDLTGDDMGNNVNVLSIPVVLPVDEMQDELAAELDANGMEVNETRIIDHPLGQAVRASYDLEIDGMDVPAAQFYIPVGRATYIITVTGPPEAIADQIAQSFRTTDSSLA